MSTQYEFRLIGAQAPDGQLDAEDLLAIVSSLKELAIRLARVETDAQQLGRPNRQMGRVARLRIGLAPGSTRILVEHRLEPCELDLELPDQVAVDAAFEGVVESIAADSRPEWITDAVAASAAGLTTALRKAAPEVEFSANGEVRSRFKTARIHHETWRPGGAGLAANTVTIVGRLEKVDIHSHGFRVRDDVGHSYNVPKVADDTAVMHLIGAYVSVTGVAERDASGQVSAIRSATIVAVPDDLQGMHIPRATALQDILNGASGPDPDGIKGVTDAEAHAYFEVMGL